MKRFKKALNEKQEDDGWRAERDTKAGKKRMLIGRNFKELRGNISLQKLADAINFDKEELYLIERGRREAGKPLLQKIAKELGISVEAFYEED